jgi:hypothetical protein
MRILFHLEGSDYRACPPLSTCATIQDSGKSSILTRSIPAPSRPVQWNAASPYTVGALHHDFSDIPEGPQFTS